MQRTHAVGIFALAMGLPCAVLLADEPAQVAATGGHRADWMSRGSFGLMVHYLISPSGNTPEEKTADFNRTVDGFDVPGFLGQVRSTGADWLIFTTGQNTRYYCSPNRFLDERKPGHTSRRDLVLEIAQGMKASEKRFIAYLPAELSAPEELHEAFGWHKDDPKQAAFQPDYQEFIKAFSLQYGKHCDGWWFDGCYEWPVFPNRNMDFAGYVAAARAGNPQAIIAFNDGASALARSSRSRPWKTTTPAKSTRSCKAKWRWAGGRTTPHRICPRADSSRECSGTACCRSIRPSAVPSCPTNTTTTRRSSGS